MIIFPLPWPYYRVCHKDQCWALCYFSYVNELCDTVLTRVDLRGRSLLGWQDSLCQASTESAVLRNLVVISLVDDQVALPMEPPWTEPAGVRCLAGVHPLMNDQVLFQVVALLAELAHVGLVGPLVLFKKLPEFTRVWTDRAAVPACLLCVLHFPV